MVVDKNGDVVKRTAADLELSYRTSNIPEKGDIVLEAAFNLKPGNYDEIKAVMDDLTFKENQNNH